MAENRAIKRISKNLEAIKAQVAGFNINADLSEIKISLALLADEWREFQSLEEKLKGKFDDLNLESVEKIENTYFELKQKLFRLEQVHEQTNTHAGNHTMDELVLNQSNFLHEISNITKRESEIRLPRVNIPVFSGNYSEFPSFRDLFEAAIHNKDNISKVHKLQYLKGLLQGEAYSLINHLTVTDANYDEAWEKIKARYDKRKHVVHALLKQFMEQPILNQNCAKSLRHLSDVSDEVIRGLKALVNKLDNDSKEAWAHEIAEVDFPTLVQLFKFLNKRSDALVSLSAIKINKSSTSKRISSLVSQSNTVMCPLCSSDHYLGRCEQFLGLPFLKRKQFAVEHKLCFNCLSSTHQSVVCRSRFTCNICRRRHHLTLHPESEADDTKEVNQSTIPPSTTNCNAVLEPESTHFEHIQAILPTAIVLITDKFGKSHQCRALLDSGSQSTFVSERCVQRLNLQRQRANINITGITANSMSSRGKTTLTLGSLYNSTIQIKVDALIINKLPSNIPGCDIDKRVTNLIGKMQLADPSFHKSAPIDILIGADKFFTVLENGQETFDSTVLQKTVFGWVVSGQSKSKQLSNCSIYTALSVQLDMDIDKTLRQFWEIEELPKTAILSPEDEECESFFNDNYRRQKDGRYTVRLPFNKTPMKLGNSINTATRRFLTLERKLANDSNLRKHYIEQMSEYQRMGHMIEINPKQDIIRDESTYYLPHHAVVKESSNTTKVRVVFDGSSKTTSGVSLNNILMVGPTIQPTLWTTLMRFRCNRIAITADIERMYRQVIVSPEDTNFQRILWRENPNEQLRHYKLTRVTFGLACSAYLAIRVLQQLAYDNGNKNILHRILNDFYVDDFLSGTDTVQGAIQLKKDIIKALREGGFPIRKWRSNDARLCDDIDDNGTTELSNDGISMITVLGLHWHRVDDMLTFKVTSEKDGRVTKRKIISEASRVFDPLGFLSPSIILLKILFQRLWLMKLDWDDELPEKYEKEYRDVRDEFKYFENIKIPRFNNHCEGLQIHGFADASEIAYCAVIYSRVVNEKGEIIVNLLTSKTKVAPVKKVSLPRLELCATQLLAKLMYSVKETIASSAKFYAWTDSTIVLAWLSTYPARWKTFVANRTSQILDKFPRQHWAHVKSAENPADHGSRGISPQKLLNTNQWWYGPEWLKQPENFWPTSQISEEPNKILLAKEMSKTNLATHTFLSTDRSDWLSTLFERRSKLNKILRIVAYVRRFVSNLKGKSRKTRTINELRSSELEGARIECIRWVQYNQLNEDITNLQRQKTVKNNSKLISLAPFIDEKGLLRVGGRLFNADCDFDSKHPVILPANHLFTERLIWETHNDNLHAGPTLTTNLIKQKYWIINGRIKIRSVLKKCVTCVKYARRTSTQLMGNLPVERTIPTRPFLNCGIDFAGPLYFATKKGRGGTNPVKGYICIFVCLSVKAVHIEPVSDLTSEAFLAALKRFVARRGVPKRIHSDNGTNFVGAKRILSDACKLIQKINNNYVISEYLSHNGIDWHYIPPSTPHFGGLWESTVKSVKTHLLKSTNNVNLTFEEMTTLLCQIESILNSRPLCTTSVNDDYEVLTPAHFLIGTSPGAVPVPEIITADSSLSRWQRIQVRIQTFWKKYYLDYLNNLQQRRKWHKSEINIQIGDIVVIKEDNTPVCKWPLGRVIQIHPGIDKMVRVVTIKTASSTIQRPVVKLCKLPVG